MTTTREQNKESAIIDTDVILSDLEVVARAGEIGFPLITNSILEEINSKKSNPDFLVARNSKSIIRRIINQIPVSLVSFPCGKPLRNDDTIKQFEFGKATLFILYRNFDNRITEAKLDIAKDYDLIFLTNNQSNKSLADNRGIRAVEWLPKNKEYKNRINSSAKINSFKKVKSVSHLTGKAPQPKKIPCENDFVCMNNNKTMQLGAKIGAGGEGKIYEINGDKRVIKIYHAKQLTNNRISKLNLMTSRSIARKGICWPEHLVFSPDGYVVGFITQRAMGFTLQKSLFVKELLLQKFPNWKRENLVKLCITLLEHFQNLHSLNVLVGDINPLNIFVDGDGTEVYIVDADSFQVEGFPCPVGTSNFSPPNLQNVNFKSTLRNIEDELFAVTTMLFMILLPGKHPYSHQGGETPQKNIKQGNFAYPLDVMHWGKKISIGPWRDIWSHLPNDLKEMFYNTFKNKKRYSIREWLDEFYTYQQEIQTGYMTNEIYPLGLQVPRGKGVIVDCSLCPKKI